MSSYHFGGDGGGESKCQIETVLYAIKDVPNMSAGYFICFFHSIHLIFSELLKVLEALECPLAHTKKYVSSLATIANVWRSIGIGSQVRKVADEWREMPTDVRKGFHSRPSKVIRTRWGSVGNIEKKLRGIMMWIGPVFEKVFSQTDRGS